MAKYLNTGLTAKQRKYAKSATRAARLAAEFAAKGGKPEGALEAATAYYDTEVSKRQVAVFVAVVAALNAA